MLIAVSASSAEWKGAERVKLHVNYVRSLEGAGLTPVLVPPLQSTTAAEEIMGGGVQRVAAEGLART